MKINILGTRYKIITKNANSKELLPVNRAGYCDKERHIICVEDLDTDDCWKNESATSKEQYRKNILRHEVIHAFLSESGLREDSLNIDSWATNEEMVDYFALQFPKMLKVFKKIGCI